MQRKIITTSLEQKANTMQQEMMVQDLGTTVFSTFSSVASAAMQDYYDEIGLQTSFNAYSYYGHTPLTAALSAVKYEYTTGKILLCQII